MIIQQTGSFRRKVKKLAPDQKQALDRAVKKIAGAPDIGTMKKGDLALVRIYKYKAKTLQYLLAYTYDSDSQTITLLAVGPHENFYRDLKSR